MTDVADAPAPVQTLLRCWSREANWPVAAEGVTTLTAAGAGLRVPVHYRSANGWHRFGTVRTADGAPVDAGLIAALLTSEAAARADIPADAAAVALNRLVDSVVRTTAHIEARRQEAEERPDLEPALPPFLAAEQGLVVGHPFHPAAKSRGEASEPDLADWSPERRGSFALHWFAADRELVASDSAMDQPVEDVLRALGAAAAAPPGTVPLPAHPWQARDLYRRPAFAELISEGLVHDLGQAGPAWFPTSSIRTVWSADAPLMLKLSLGMRITNSRRNNLRGELGLGVTVARLIAAGLPLDGFGIVRDPAWVALDHPRAPGAELGLETALRDNPFGRSSPVVCVAGLLDARPDRAGVGSDLARLVGGRDDAALRWFDRYLDVVAMPLLRLYLDVGLALEAHHQNTLVGLDADGMPAAGWYRDSQGYWIAESAADELLARLGTLVDRSSLVFDDTLVAERFTYYFLVNNLLGLVGVLGSEGLADEQVLLGRLRQRVGCLASQRATDGRRTSRDALLEQWLTGPTLRCKANLLTTVDGRDELVGHPASQSVYVDIPNPLLESS